MIEVLKQALDALELALRSHGVMLLSDPPQDAWKTYGVEGNARQAIASLSQAIAELESQEPDYWLGYGLQAHTEKPFENATALYIHPPQRTWVGLTNDELTDLFYNTNLGQASAVAQAIELLKEKNT